MIAHDCSADISHRIRPLLTKCFFLFGLLCQIEQASFAGEPEMSLPEDTKPSSHPSDPDPDPPTSCPYTRGEINLKSWGQASLSNPITFLSPEANTINCLHQAIQSVSNSDYVVNGVGVYRDDRFIIKFWEYFNGRNSYGNYYSAGQISVNISLPNGSKCTSVVNTHTRDYYGDYNAVCASGYFYIRSQDQDGGPGKACDVVSESAVAKECGNLPSLGVKAEFIKSSPVSLLLSEKPNPDIDAAVSFVTFPVNPSLPKGTWYAWKASSVAPLIVYDPSHNGSITSASQLFGNWTFGGKRSASLSKPDAETSARPWKNGYEALGSLDRNGDGAIRGEELQDLALWFDHNQDGISQSGEVRSLGDVGITALFFQVDSEDSVRGILTANIGFEKTSNGIVTNGPSVDWYADTASSPSELANRYIFFRATGSPKSLPEAPKTTNPQAGNSQESALTNEPSPFLGAWEWTYDEPGIDIEKIGVTQGYFVIGAEEDTHQIFGYSLVGVPFKSSPSRTLEGRVNFYRFEATSKTADSGNSSLHFTLQTDRSQMVTNAEISPDGKTLSGTSVAYVNVDNTTRTVTYHWKAKRPA